MFMFDRNAIAIIFLWIKNIYSYVYMISNIVFWKTYWVVTVILCVKPNDTIKAGIKGRDK